tara:strand:- start:1647 stop:5249 length:3603 start_codon:yes stop_codon:yes gene_type:complete
MVREISNIDFQLTEDLPNGSLKSVQFVTLLDLVSDGAEIEGFATPSKNNIGIPTSILRPANPSSPEFTSTEENIYIRESQKDIFINGRAIRSKGGFENIKNTSLSIRVGKEDQPIMLGVNEQMLSGDLTPGEVLNNRDPEGNKVSGSLSAGTDSNNTPRAAIVTLNWASLRQLNPQTGANQSLGINFGEHSGLNFVEIKIRLRSNNGNIIATSQHQLNGVSLGPFSKDYRIDIPVFAYETEDARSQHYPISVEVLREDIEFRANPAIGKHPFDKDGRNLLEEGERRFTTFSFARLQGAIPFIPPEVNPQESNNFSKTAYIGLRYSAEQFPNIPQRKYFIRGIKVKIPTGTGRDFQSTGRIIYPANYNFVQLTPEKHWTTDPVWILYALLTEDYGLGISELKIDKASFFAASLYCSTPLPNQTSPRYSFNGVIKTRKKALDIIREVAGLMRATLYYRNGSLKIAIDKPETLVSYLFTNANVVDGLFNYSGTDKDKKFTQVNVSYFNNDIQDSDLVSVRDQLSVDKFGLNEINIQSLYTTDREQALRFGRSILYTSNFETEVVTFDCGIEAACILEPFMIIKIADKTKETIRASGRIKTVTSSTVLIVDDSTDTSVGVFGDTFLVIDTDGKVQERTIQSVNGSTVTLSSALSPSPQPGTIWAVKTGNVQHRKYRVTNIKQKDNFVFSVTAIVYDDNKYTFIDTHTNFGIVRQPTTLLNKLESPEIQEVKEELSIVNNRAQSNIVLNFAHVNGARSYQVSYKYEGGDPIVQNIKDNQFFILNNKAGNYEFSVRTISATFSTSELVSIRSFNAIGLTEPPGDVTNLRSEESGDNLIIRWDRSTDKDVLFGGFVDIKYSLISDGTATTQNANNLATLEGNSDQITLNDYQNGEYFVSFIDVAGNKSLNPTSIVINRTIASNNLLAAQIRENSNSFQGTKTNLVFDNAINGLRLTSGTTIDSLTDFNTLALADGTTFSNIDDIISGITSSGNYLFENNIDLGAPFRFHVEQHFKKSGFDTATLWDSYADDINDWPDIFTTGTTVLTKSANLTFQVAKSQTGTPSTSFETFINTDIIARTISFKVLVENQSTYENIDIEELGVNLIFRPRTERSIDNSSATNGVLTSSGSGATTVTFNKKFFLGTTTIGGSTDKFKPVIGININNMQSGDFFTIDSVTISNFVISIKNGSSFVARQFTYSAFGYGEG